MEMPGSAILAAAAALALLALGGCMAPADPGASGLRAEHLSGELAARPLTSNGNGQAGLRAIGGNGLLYVPSSYQAGRRAPLVVMLHGAGGTAQHSLELARPHADRLGFILFAPKSRAASWDVISDQAYGPDVRALDAALEQVFADYRVDPERLAVAGFSDGASYALSLGLTNGGLFTDILAFSPGFMAPGRTQGKPRIFISHGTADRVLPIDICSRRIVPRLKSAGYPVDYREFTGGHNVPPDLARAAFNSLASE